MNQLVFVSRSKAATDSLTVSEAFGKDHNKVLRDIRNLKCSESFRQSNFGQSSYINSQGKSLEKYIMTESGFVILAMGYTGAKAMEFKEAYIAEFENMREALRIKQSSEWLQTRKQGKLTRRAETDVLANLIQYAENQGSTHAKMFYVNYSKMVNKAVGIKSGQREFATEKVLQVIASIEDNIIALVTERMEQGVYYKEIYKQCKEEAEGLMRYTRLPEQRLLLKGGTEQ